VLLKKSTAPCAGVLRNTAILRIVLARSNSVAAPQEPRLEVEDDAGDGLEVVLVFAEEVVEHIIAFGA
jgi:hypothetical protein